MKKFILLVVAGLVLVFGGGTLLTNTELGNYIEDETGIDLSLLDFSSESEVSESEVSEVVNEGGTGGTDLTGYQIPEYTGEHVIIVNDNVPYFNEEDMNVSNGSWETFADYDSLGRVGVADALLHQDLMPTQSREDSGSISHIKPSGFEYNGESNNQRVDINGKSQWIYNRSHLIGFQLTGHMNNEHNLMTGTRTFNFPNMENFESELADYLKDTNNHVRYRVTPAFNGEEQLARGLFMEAQSVEDDSIQFNVFIHNVEDGVNLNYTTGEVSQ